MKTYSTFRMGDMVIEYLLDPKTEGIGFRIYPAVLKPRLVKHRKFLDEDPALRLLPNGGKRLLTNRLDPLVHLKLRGEREPAGFSQGRTSHNGFPQLRFRRQKVVREKEGTTIHTYLGVPGTCEARHTLLWKKGSSYLEIQTRITNRSTGPITLEAASSFSLGGITPFDRADAPEQLYVHRFRSYWSAEGRHERLPVEALHLDRSWCGAPGFSERFGQVGTLPVRGFFPFVGMEDAQASAFWGAQLAWAGSWQMEVYRRDDRLAIAGGLADREFGHWWKTLSPGETLALPPATLATSAASFEDLCSRLAQFQETTPYRPAPTEANLPIIFNEYGATWGTPERDRVLRLAREAAEMGCRYFVIDAGWYVPPEADWWNAHGDWTPGSEIFPNGLEEVAAEIRKLGLVPGLWFEFESCGEHSKAFGLTKYHLHRDGHPITVGTRRFWDFRDPWVKEYLRERVTNLLRRCGIGYLKIDYNETVGLGCDGAESPGEGLREHLLGVTSFIRDLRKHIPGIIIENCAGGGHRLEPSLMSLCDMGSISDAIGARENPIIAANLHSLILPRKAQVWAILHPDHSKREMLYSLAAGFLGRLCLSGSIDHLREEQRSFVKSVLKQYTECTPVIREGISQRHGAPVKSYRHPKGWQGIVRTHPTGSWVLVVLHAFEAPGATVEIPLPRRKPQTLRVLAENAGEVKVRNGLLKWHPPGDFCATVALLGYE